MSEKEKTVKEQDQKEEIKPKAEKAEAKKETTKKKKAAKSEQEAPKKKIIIKKSTRGKKYREYIKTFERRRRYPLSEGVDILLNGKTLTKFDATAEIHMNLNIDQKQSDQIVRSTVVLPHGTGKKLRIVAFVDESKVKEAKEAGAVEAGTETLIGKIEKGWLEFDVAIATPDQMKGLGKIAKTLGQKGLMPNPKAGTVTMEITKSIKEISGGKVEFRADKLSNLHNSVGKLSFGKEKLLENLRAYIKAVQEAKPTGVKGTYINTITLASTMGPGIKIDLGKINA